MNVMIFEPKKKKKKRDQFEGKEENKPKLQTQIDTSNFCTIGFRKIF